MNRILSYVCISTLLFIGIGEVKADTTEDFKPVTEVYYRTKLDAGVYSWNSGYPKSPSETNVVFAGHQRAGMFVLQKYKVENLASVKSITLTLTGTASGDANGSDALAIWSFASNDWSETSDAATLAAAVNAKVGLDLNTTGTPTGTSLKDVSNNKTAEKQCRKRWYLHVAYHKQNWRYEQRFEWRPQVLQHRSHQRSLSAQVDCYLLRCDSERWYCGYWLFIAFRCYDRCEISYCR